MIDCFDLLAVQGTLKSLLQYHSPTVNFLALSLLSGPTVTSVHDYWKNYLSLQKNTWVPLIRGTLASGHKPR